ncbi:MAG: PilZ domain-containing protein [Spirochaetales bacterium]|nr:PilZ domain-containing protein [Spirochaetales bacterium]
MDERRKYKRKQISIDVEYDMQPEHLGKANATDISQGGICLITKTQLQRGREFDIKFYVPEFNHAVKVTGKVAWSREEGEKRKLHYINGIEFRKMDERDLDVIIKFVEGATFVDKKM